MKYDHLREEIQRWEDWVTAEQAMIDQQFPTLEEKAELSYRLNKGLNEIDRQDSGGEYLYCICRMLLFYITKDILQGIRDDEAQNS